jgi:hypothetical protein
MFVAYVWSSFWSITGLLAGVFVMLIAGNRMRRARRSRPRRIAAAVLWLSAAIVAHYSVVVNGIEYHPTWIAHLVSATAAWIMCWRLLPHWSWSIAPTYWTAVTAAFLAGVIGEIWWSGVLLLLLVLYVQWARGDSRKQRRLAQVG